MRKKILLKAIFVFVIGLMFFWTAQKTKASNLDINELWTSTGESEASFYSHSVASAGDVNNDGYQDILIGAMGDYKAYLYLGGANGVSNTPTWTASGDLTDSFNRYAEVISSAGDVNGDGYGDVIIGVRDSGKVYLYLGNNGGLNTAYTSAFTIGDNSVNVYSIASVGDINSDGYDDVIIANRAGRAYLYLGNANGLNTGYAWSSLDLNQTIWSSGTSVTAGDINNDSFNDVIIAVDGGGALDGVNIYLYFGNASGLDSSPAWTFLDSQYNFGQKSYITSGDINGDGYDDVIAGVYNASGNYESKTLLFLGSSDGLGAVPVWIFAGDGDIAGYSVSSDGDINEDGYDDILIGTTYCSGAGVSEDKSAGKAYLFLGNKDGLDSIPVWSSSGDKTNARYGCDVSFVGNTNADNFDDIVIGAYYYDLYGKAYLYTNILDLDKKIKFVTKDAKSPEIKIKGKNKKYYAGDFEFIFSKFPEKLQAKKYYLKIKRQKKYPKSYSGQNKTLKKYWTIETNLNKYKTKSKKDGFQTKLVFKYTNKELKTLKKKNKNIKEKNLKLKYYDTTDKKWKIVSAKHNKKKNTLTATFTSFSLPTTRYVIGKE